MEPPATASSQGGGLSVGVGVTLDELTTVVLAPNAGPMTLEGTNTYLLGAPGAGEVVVVDPGPDDDAHHRAVVAAAGAREAAVAGVVLTHHHADHAAAAGWAARWSVPLWAFAPAMIDAEARVVDDGGRVDLAGVGLEAVHTPGHSSDHLCWRVSETGAVLSGDHVLGRGSALIAWPDGDMAAYLASLHRLRAVGATALYPGHGPRVDDPVRAVDRYLAHRHQREQQVLAALAAGASTAAGVVARVYADVDPGLHPAAERSVLAHLAKLERDGRVRRSGRAERAADVPYAPV